MKSEIFSITEVQLQELITQFPNLGKNSHVGNLAVRIVELYFLSLDAKTEFKRGQEGADLQVISGNKIVQFEIKGTTDKDIAWSKLKVSSQPSYNALINGLTLIRVTGIGETAMTLHFMTYSKDFDLVPEVRWSIKPIKPLKAG